MGVRFLVHLGASTLAMAATLAVLNHQVDPFALREADPSGAGAGHRAWARVAMPHAAAAAGRRQALLLGTSRAARGFTRGDLDAALGPTFNAGLAGCTAAEAALYARSLSRMTGARRLLVGLDLGMFLNTRPRPFPSEEERLRWLQEGGFTGRLRALQETLLSRDATAASMDALLRGPRDDLALAVQRRGRRALARAGVREAMQRWPAGEPNYALQLAALRTLLSEAPGPVVLFVNPQHVWYLEAVHAASLDAWAGRWRRDLVQTAQSARDRGKDVVLWDFSAPHPLTTGPIDAADSPFQDGSHFVPAVGRRVLDRLRGRSSPDGFGVLLEPGTIEQALQAMDTGRRAWEMDHPADAAEIATLRGAPAYPIP